MSDCFVLLPLYLWNLVYSQALEPKAKNKLITPDPIR
jgi:hypothetical protein